MPSRCDNGAEQDGGSAYALSVARPVGLDKAPAALLVSGTWRRDGVADDPAVEAAQELAGRLADAIGDEPLRDVAERAEIAHTTISDMLNGRTWPTFVSIFRLERALGAQLWPSGHTEG